MIKIEQAVLKMNNHIKMSKSAIIKIKKYNNYTKIKYIIGKTLYNEVDVYDDNTYITKKEQSNFLNSVLDKMDFIEL